MSDFNEISVREKQGNEIIETLLEIDVPVVLDPTMLLSVEDWINYMDDSVQKNDYILVYLMAETNSIFSFAQELSKSTDAEIIYINDRFYRKKGMKNISRISPNQWLSLFHNAKYVVTNSFHGLAFSINFNKNFFVELLPEPAKVNSRLKDTLDMFELNNRLINDGYNENIFDDINYSSININLNIERERSLKYLENLKYEDRTKDE